MWLRQLAAPDAAVPLVTNPTDFLRRVQADPQVYRNVQVCLGPDAPLVAAWKRHRATGKPSTVVVGGTFAVREPESDRYNAAFVFGPGQAEPGHYEKIHLVLFGEYIPFRRGRLRWLYLWLNRLTPWGASGQEYSLTAGNTFRTFEVTAAAGSGAGERFRFATPICYEDTTPYICRTFVAGGDDGRDEKGVDFFANISNDGWFNRSVELTQHLAVSVFRAVENRVGIARAVNTGMSGFIDSTGRVQQVLAVGKQGHLVAHVMVDSRRTVYSRWGDCFGWGCAAATVLLLLEGRWRRRRGTSAKRQA